VYWFNQNTFLYVSKQRRLPTLMATSVPSSGAISFKDLQDVFGGTIPIGLDEYFQDALTGFTAGVADIPNRGNSIGILVFRGKSKGVSVSYVTATGGTTSTFTSNGVTYTVHRFDSDGTFTVTKGGAVEVLLVGGGGGGGRDAGGGGGGGGVRRFITTVSPGNTTIVVGSGGTGAISSANATNGGASSFGDFSVPGGGGGNRGGNLVFSGGSGGGGAYANSTSTTRGGGIIDVYPSNVYPSYTNVFSDYSKNLMTNLHFNHLRNLVNDSKVSFWNGFTQETDANRPVYKSFGGLNNIPFVSFTQANSHFVNGGRKSLQIATNGGFTCIVLARFTGTATSYERLIDFSTGAGNDSVMISRNSTNAEFEFAIYSGTNLSFALTGGKINQNVWRVYAFRYTHSSKKREIIVNNVSITDNSNALTTDVTNRTVTQSYIGRNFSGTSTQYFNGDIGALYVYDRALSDTELTTMHEFLYYGILPIQVGYPGAGSNTITLTERGGGGGGAGGPGANGNDTASGGIGALVSITGTATRYGGGGGGGNWRNSGGGGSGGSGGGGSGGGSNGAGTAGTANTGGGGGSGGAAANGGAGGSGVVIVRYISSAPTMFGDVALTSNTQFAMGTFYMNPNYTGAVIRIRRSADNVEEDFYSHISGSLTTQANGAGDTLEKWLGSSVAYVTTLYDQSGNNRHLTQSTDANQPIYDVSRNCIVFSSARSTSMSISGYKGVTGTTRRTALMEFTANPNNPQNLYGDIYGSYGTDSSGGTTWRWSLRSEPEATSHSLVANASSGAAVRNNTLVPFNFNRGSHVGVWNLTGGTINDITTTVDGYSMTNVVASVATSTSVNTTSGSDVTFGYSSFASAYYNFDFYGAMLYDTSLTSAKMITAQKYMMTPLLDQCSSLTRVACNGAYSTVLLTNTYTGAVLRIRKGVSTTDDFYADAIGNLTNSAGTSLASWLGTDTGFVQTWYDQSGNGNNATQATNGSQPFVEEVEKPPLSNSKIYLDWNDLPASGNITNWNNFSQDVVSRQPTISANGGINGQRTAQFTRSASNTDLTQTLENNTSTTYNINTNGGFTFACLVRPEGTVVTYEHIFNCIAGTTIGTIGDIQFLRFETSNRIQVYLRNTNDGSELNYVSPDNVLETNTWKVIVFKYDKNDTTRNANGSMYLYVNDTVQTTSIHTETYSSVPANRTISRVIVGDGRDFIATGDPQFNGKIGGLYFWDTPLSRNQITGIYNYLRFALHSSPAYKVNFATNKFLTIPSGTVPVGTLNAPYTFIFKHGSITNKSSGTFISAGSSSNNQSNSLRTAGVNSAYRNYWLNNDFEFGGTTTPDNAYVVARYDGVHRNGIIKSFTTGSLNNAKASSGGTTATGTQYIGVASSGNSEYLNGELYNAMIFKEAISYPDIQILSETQDILPVTNGLILHLDAYQHTSGTTWKDLSGNGNDFTINSGAYGTDTDGIRRMDFNSTNGVAKRIVSNALANVPSTAPTNMTIIVFCAMNSATNLYRTLIRATGSVAHHIIIDTNTNNLGAFYPSSFRASQYANNSTIKTFPITDVDDSSSKYNMMTFRLSNSSPQFEFMYNGANVVSRITDTTAVNLSVGFASIGGFHNDVITMSTHSQYWGKISLFLTYNRLLNDSEINAIYDAYSGRYKLTPSIDWGVSIRDTTDTNQSIYVIAKPLTGLIGKTLTNWSFTTLISTSKSITPLLFETNGTKVLKLQAIGTTRTISASGTYRYSFGLVSGSNVIKTGFYCFGWKDGTSTTSNTGVISFDTTTSEEDSVYHTPSIDITSSTIGETITFSGSDIFRRYSVKLNYDTNLSDTSSLSSIIAWWKFDNNPNDLSRNNDLTPSGTMTYDSTDKKVGTHSVSFSGSNNFQITNDGKFSPANMTIAVWIKPVSSNTAIQAIASCRDGSSFNGWILYINKNNLEFWTGNGTGWQGITDIYTTFGGLGAWTHVCVTLTNSVSTGNAKVYINGELYTTTALDRMYNQNSLHNLRIGAGQNETTAAFNLVSGTLLDDFRMYDKVLTATEIKDIYDSTV
jgi:hypothetical protein